MSVPIGELERTIVRELHLPEVADEVDLRIGLERIYQDGLPGLLIRRDGLFNGTQTHEDLASLVMQQLEIIRPAVEFPYRSFPKLKLGGFSVPMAGKFHNDSRVYSNNNYLRIHKTVMGAGKVFLASSMDTITSESDVWSMLSDTADREFADGYVWSGFINPDVYVADLSEGDFTIFPTKLPDQNSHSNAGPVWHRFDTTIAPRMSEVIELGLDTQD
jgi:hypothetical protein